MALELPKHITRHHSFTTTSTLIDNTPKVVVKTVYFCHYCTQFLINPKQYAEHSTTCIQHR